MWKKQDDTNAAPSTHERDAARLLGDALSDSPSSNDEFQKRNLPAGSPEFPAQDSNQPLTSPTMVTYTDAVKEFTTNATAFIEHLPLLAKARASYEEAMRISAEVRRTLDASDENLRTLMTHLEQQVSLRELRSATEKKPPEPAKVERMKGSDEAGGRAFRWP
jgi:hypothetical protein